MDLSFIDTDQEEGLPLVFGRPTVFVLTTSPFFFFFVLVTQLSHLPSFSSFLSPHRRAAIPRLVSVKSNHSLGLDHYSNLTRWELIFNLC